MRWHWTGGVFLAVAAGVVAYSMTHAPLCEEIATAEKGPWTRATLPPLRQDVLSILNAEQRCALGNWIHQNKIYAVITRDYCDCADTIPSGRTPHALSGDFNGDGQDDFAILLENTSKTGLSGEHGGPGILLIFNGPFSTPDHQPAELDDQWAGYRESDALSVDPQGRLTVGAEGTDDLAVIRWTGKSYKADYTGDDD